MFLHIVFDYFILIYKLRLKTHNNITHQRKACRHTAQHKQIRISNVLQNVVVGAKRESLLPLFRYFTGLHC